MPKETTGAFDEDRAHDLHITRQTRNPLRDAASWLSVIVSVYLVLLIFSTVPWGAASFWFALGMKDVWKRLVVRPSVYGSVTSSHSLERPSQLTFLRTKEWERVLLLKLSEQNRTAQECYSDLHIVHRFDQSNIYTQLYSLYIYTQIQIRVLI